DTSILSAIGNLVWLDENSDGLQDPGEPGIPNVTVNLQDISGSVISTTVTDAHGGYLFPRLTGGVYTVTLTGSTLPAGLSQSTNAVLPNADFGNQTLPYPIILGAGDENLTADFGFIWNPDDVNNNTGLAALGDCVWFDADTDGIRDPDEAGVANVLLNLLGPGADNLFGTGDDVLLDTARTDAACRYAFTDLPAGAYQVQVDSSNFNPGEALAGTVQTADPDNYGQIPISPDNLTTTPVVLGPGDVFLNADFGYRPVACGSIGDTVWFDANADTVDAGEYGIDGVTVALIADSNGNGTWDGGEPIMATDVTTAGGQYLFPCLPLDDGDGDADYLVWVNDTNNVLSGLAQTFDADGTATGNISATALDGVILTDDPTQDFSYTPVGHTGADGLVGDTIYLDINVNGTQDAGEPALEGILVQLEMPGGNMLTTVTDENGRYTFGSLDPAGMYTITVDTTGFLSGLNNSGDPDTPGAPDSRSIVNLSGSGPVDLDQDFGYGNSAANTGGVGNLVWVDTNGDGVFAGEDGPDGTPGTDDDEPVLGGVTVDLYFDGDGNGRLDPNEPRISSGITAGTIDDVTYGTNGIYLFSGLPPGNYVADV
ncbi:MAG: SdrD B-like domain-containing protein, partial [Anaerolineae bacterium]